MKPVSIQNGGSLPRSDDERAGRCARGESRATRAPRVAMARRALVDRGLELLLREPLGVELEQLAEDLVLRAQLARELRGERQRDRRELVEDGVEPGAVEGRELGAGVGA